jgi:hypothetical protein
MGGEEAAGGVEGSVVRWPAVVRVDAARGR